MPTLLCHITVKPDKTPRFEEILKLLAADTHATEADCLRYEYWRGAQPAHYYALLSFKTTLAFYEHQASKYHEQYLPELLQLFDAFTIEYVDPVQGGGSGLPVTRNDPLPASAPAEVKSQPAKYPIAIQAWWDALRSKA